jgi:zinc/manganese transport system permease protein
MKAEGFEVIVDLVTSLYTVLWKPFADFVFLQRALVGCIALSLSCGPVGVFLILRRMSLIGDALSHGLLPGVALAFFFYGFAMLPMTLGGMVAGLLVALLAGVASRHTILNEDATFAGFYLISMALGVLLMSLHGSQVDLMHVLFGTVLSIASPTLLLLGSVTTVTLVLFAAIYRPLILECFDPQFFRAISGKGAWIHFLFLILVTLNLVAAFQALGTLMALGILLLPAITARLVCRQVWHLCVTAIGIACVSSYVGLLLSYHFAWPSGPSIVLVAGLFYGLALVRVVVSRVLKLAVAVGLVCFFPHAGWAGHTCDARPRVVVSFSILKDFVQQIAGEAVNVDSLVGPNADAHVYEPKPQDIQLIQEADLVILNGFGFERWMTNLLVASGYQGVVVRASDGVPPRCLDAGGGQTVIDPHAWHNVRYAQIYINNITQSLQQLLPSHQEEIIQNAKRYQQRLATLDRWIFQMLEGIPLERRRVLTNHDGFGYFGEAYGIQFVSPLGLSTEGEASAQVVASLITQAREAGIAACFFENISNSRLVEQIAKEGELTLGGQLYSDALSFPTEPAATYEAMMRANVERLTQGMLAADSPGVSPVSPAILSQP